MKSLRTDRLVLQPVSADDFPDLCALWADPEVTRFISGQPMSSEDVWLRLLRDIGHWHSLGYGNWSIRTHDGTLAGVVGLFDYKRLLDPPFDAPEIGWAVAPAFHGKGVASEAVGAALKSADRDYGIARTVCMISDGNLPSIKLATRMGFNRYGEGLYKGQNVTLYERLLPPQ